MIHAGSLLSCYLLLLVSLTLATPRTSPPDGAVVVRQSGTKSGEYSTISAAAATLSGGETIFIYPGTYEEQVNISVADVTMLCYTEDTGTYKSNVVTITNNLNAQDNGGNDACATLRAEKDGFNLYNCIVKNTYGQGKQATAVAARGNKQGFYGSSFTGYQDTLLADGGYQYYSNCYIEGAVDYIYGDASAWFGECTLASNGGGAITANSREEASDASYYVIDNSVIVQASSSNSDLTEKVYLGRPWRVLARVVFQNSELPDLINPKGYTTLASNATPIFSEYGNTGNGSDTSERLYYTPISAAISRSSVLGSDWKSWTNTTY
ncbi:pectin methyl esterase [Armillaria novae-zelandiae]|uniref:pectinesterase n=1 Tax=Armillaria novae-zelandiae TaxID=153914 RepID=A0AA39P367_9AGAR|nr:pectin methyl esterase [Armillaria novae-zelandiae]